ncbi:hypothetical protein N4S67_01985 [Mycobacterium sp. CPCC 205710]|uniref:2,4-diaminopentanoate dehydrogenase C-terminal domain-containing protein n=2 Tax=Mycobacterium deserti TaxID=2978347 RepID=A0ABT2M6D0_9MYCO|nr:hypothetical protein [Mycobacterium deserti]
MAHFGTGHTGMVVLRQLLQRDDLELVGHLVHSPDKVGKDSGVLAGGDPVGVTATDDFGAFCALDADCVTYLATDFGRPIDEVIDQMCLLLAAGKNIVTTTFVRLVYAPSLDPETLEKLQSACTTGQSSFFGTGVSPGFTVDALPTYCASLCAAPGQVRVAERILQGTYEDPLSFAALGFGRVPDGDLTNIPADHWAPHFAGTMAMLADGFGWQLDEVLGYQDLALADRDYESAAGSIRQGTVGSVRLRFEGWVDGEPRLLLSWIYTMPDDLRDGWAPPLPRESAARRFTHITIDADPEIAVTVELTGGELPGVTATASRAVNAIPAVCRAAPTVHTALDLVITPA